MPRKEKVIKPVEETVVETEQANVEETVKTVKPQRKPNACLFTSLLLRLRTLRSLTKTFSS